MRVGLLGPVGDHIDALEAAAAFLVGTLAVDCVYYLGDDNPLVLLPKRSKDSYTENAFWGAVERLATASAESIDAFVKEERRLSACDNIHRFGEQLVHRLNSPRGHRWIFCHASRHLTKDDQERGHVLAYGNSPEWLIQRAGEQILVAPGPFEGAGLMLLDDADGLEVDIFNRKCEPVHRRRLDFAPTMPPPPLTDSP